MSSACGIPIPVPQASNTSELCGSSATLSSSHKRVGSCSQASLYVPEAKRPQLSSPTNDNWPPSPGANFTLYETEADGNIASTDSYIEELLDIIQSGDESTPPFKPGSKAPAGSVGSSPPPLLFHLHTEDPVQLPDNTSTSNLLTLSQLLPDACSAMRAGNALEHPELGRKNVGEVTVLDIDDYYDDIMGIVLLKSLPTSIDDLAMKPASGGAEAPAALSRRSGGQADIALGSLSFDDEKVSKNLDCRPFDEDDLEVAMINESFEEQQKQSLAYECGALESFFLAEVSSVGVEEEGKQLFSEPSTSPSTSPEADEESSSEEDTDSCHASPKSSEFIPVLTPKSRRFVKRHPLSQASTSSQLHSVRVPYADYGTPTVVQPTSGKPLRRHCEDEERSRRLNEKLEMMMLVSGSEEMSGSRGTDAQRTGLIGQTQAAGTTRKVRPDETEVSSTTILDECADAAEAIAHDVVASLFSSPVVFTAKSPTPDEQGKISPPSVRQLLECDDEEIRLVEAKLLSESLLRDLSVLSEEESPVKGDDPLKSDVETCRGSKSLYANAGVKGTSSSTNSSSSAICALAGTKAETDEQKVPIVD